MRCASDLEYPPTPQFHPAVVELSTFLNRMWAALGTTGRATLRNASGVAMKLSNFQRFDPNVLNKGPSGLAHGAKADKEVWDEFASDRSNLQMVAAAIRLALQSEPAVSMIKETVAEPAALEGALLFNLHRYRERSDSLARKVRSTRP